MLNKGEERNARNNPWKWESIYLWAKTCPWECGHMLCVIRQPHFKLNISAIKIEKSKARLRWFSKEGVLCCANDPILCVLHSLYLTIVGVTQHYATFIPFWQLFRACFFMWHLLYAEISGYASLTVCLENPSSLQMISRSWSHAASMKTKQSQFCTLPSFPIPHYTIWIPSKCNVFHCF